MVEAAFALPTHLGAPTDGGGDPAHDPDELRGRPHMDAICYSHPFPDRLRKPFVGGTRSGPRGRNVRLASQRHPGALTAGLCADLRFPRPPDRHRVRGLLLTEVRQRQEQAVFTLYVMAFGGILMGWQGR